MIVLILIATLAYALAILAFARGPISIDSNLVGTIINFFGTLVPLALLLISGFSFKQLQNSSSNGLLWALAGGLGIGVFTLALTRIFSQGGNVSFVTPLIYGGAIALSAFVGRVFFKETLPATQLVGMIVVAIGVGIIVYSKYQERITV